MQGFVLVILYFAISGDGYNILGIFPHSARSHHIYFTALVEELSRRQHNVTVINYHPMPNLPKVVRISLLGKENASVTVNTEKRLELLSISDISMAYTTAIKYKDIANRNCIKMIENKKIRKIIDLAVHFDLVIIEQFVSDCGFAIAYKLNAPTIGISAHILKPWSYSRLGAPNNPAFVPNHFFASGAKPNLFNKMKSLIVNYGMNLYYERVIQKSDQEIVNKVYPDVPPLENLGKNMSLVLINQYFPLTRPQLYSSNVIEVGGLHINNKDGLRDKGLKTFLDSAQNGVVYISFGSLASNLPRRLINSIIQLLRKSNMAFVWKTDITHWDAPKNVFIGKWMPQVALLCHPKVIGFISHSGMLSTTEAVHCGVPIVSVPLFGDQFANGRSVVESGVGVAVDVLTITEKVLEGALETILEEKYQRNAKQLSGVWKDRPMSPMDTAIFWIEYVARNKGAVNMKPVTVDMTFYEYFCIDIFLLIVIVLVLVVVSLLLTAKITFFAVRRIKLFLKDRKSKYFKVMSVS